MARVMLTIPDELLHDVDRVARQEHRTRSELLREAARLYLRGSTPPAAKVSERIEAAGMIERLREQAVRRAEQTTNSTEIIRSFREPIVDKLT